MGLKGRLATPGFNDAHTHFLAGSLGLFEVNLFNAGSLEEMQRRIAAYAKAHPGEEWITGAGWEYAWLPNHRLPGKDDIDKTDAGPPAYLKSYRGHTAWVSSAESPRAAPTAAAKSPGNGDAARGGRAQ